MAWHCMVLGTIPSQNAWPWGSCAHPLLYLLLNHKLVAQAIRFRFCLWERFYRGRCTGCNLNSHRGRVGALVERLSPKVARLRFHPLLYNYGALTPLLPQPKTIRDFLSLNSLTCKRMLQGSKVWGLRLKFGSLERVNCSATSSLHGVSNQVTWCIV